MSRRITLTDRERHVIATVLAFMTSRSKAINDEGELMLSLCRTELIALRKRMLEEEPKNERQD